MLQVNQRRVNFAVRQPIGGTSMKSIELILRRSVAYFLDIFFLFLILAPLAFVVEYLLGIQPQTSGQVWMAAIISFSIPVWTYFTLSDASKNGASVGKTIMGIHISRLEPFAKLSLQQALARTATKLLPWELAHVFGFALSDTVGDKVRAAGLVAANVLTLLYFVAFVITGGRRSIHDLVVSTQVIRRTRRVIPRNKEQAA